MIDGDRRGGRSGASATGDRRFGRDARAVSTTLGYVLALGITAVLVSGLLVAAGGFVEDQRERVVRSELEVVGQQVASGVSVTDRLVAASGSNTRASARLRLPEEVADREYTVRIVPDGSAYAVDVRVEDPDQVVTVGFVTTTPLQTGTTVRGGTLLVSYDESGGHLTLRRAP